MNLIRYPNLVASNDVMYVLQEIVRIRNEQDLSLFLNLSQQFIQGRLSTRIPTASDDVVDTDRINDTVFDAVYQYTLVNIGDVLRWDRRMLDTGW